MPTNKVSYARKARIHLSKADPVLARIIAEVGALGITPRRERFQALARAIIFQQLAGAAANAIYGRFVALFPDVEFPSPEQVLAKSDAELRSVGLSEKKALYIKDLATHVRDRKLDFHKFHRMTDDEIIAHLTQVKGIGKWTAEMFLMFHLGRPDVMPGDDLGVQSDGVRTEPRQPGTCGAAWKSCCPMAARSRPRRKSQHARNGNTAKCLAASPLSAGPGSCGPTAGRSKCTRP
jgi:DNA-3-methyladenine glycosylase II